MPDSAPYAPLNPDSVGHAVQGMGDRNAAVSDHLNNAFGNWLRDTFVNPSPDAGTDMVGRLLGLDPTRRDLDMHNQLVQNLYDYGGDILGEELANLTAETNYTDPIMHLARGGGNLIGLPASMIRDNLTPIKDTLWGVGEDVAGPQGLLPRQAESAIEGYRPEDPIASFQDARNRFGGTVQNSANRAAQGPQTGATNAIDATTSTLRDIQTGAQSLLSRGQAALSPENLAAGGLGAIQSLPGGALKDDAMRIYQTQAGARIGQQLGTVSPPSLPSLGNPLDRLPPLPMMVGSDPPPTAPLAEQSRWQQIKQAVSDTANSFPSLPSLPPLPTSLPSMPSLPNAGISVPGSVSSLVGNARTALGEMGIGGGKDATGAVTAPTMVGQMDPEQISKPAETSAGATAAYDVVPANDGIGVQSTRDGSDRTWMEEMLDGDAIVTTEYKGPPTADMTYQAGHGAATNNHAAYDISCESGDCHGKEFKSPVSGTVVCAGYGQGTGGALGSPQCTYSQNTTQPNADGSPAAHTVVVEIGTDENGNPVQVSFNHVGASNLKPGQTINVGDVLGTIGNTDGGPHIHVEGWVGNPDSGYTIEDPQLVVGGHFTGGESAPAAAPATTGNTQSTGWNRAYEQLGGLVRSGQTTKTGEFQAETLAMMEADGLTEDGKWTELAVQEGAARPGSVGLPASVREANFNYEPGQSPSVAPTTSSAPVSNTPIPTTPAVGDYTYDTSSGGEDYASGSTGRGGYRSGGGSYRSGRGGYGSPFDTGAPWGDGFGFSPDAHGFEPEDMESWLEAAGGNERKAARLAKEARLRNKGKRMSGKKGRTSNVPVRPDSAIRTKTLGNLNAAFDTAFTRR